jgi:hypothetical protein
VQGVTPGAFCAQYQHLWYGYTVKGVLMQCKTSSTEPATWRWRAV